MSDVATVTGVKLTENTQNFGNQTSLQMILQLILLPLLPLLVLLLLLLPHAVLLSTDPLQSDQCISEEDHSAGEAPGPVGSSSNPAVTHSVGIWGAGR